MAFKKKEEVEAQGEVTPDVATEETCACSCDEDCGNEVEVFIQRVQEKAYLPEYKTAGAAGMDLYACLKDGLEVIIGPNSWALIGTGVAMAIPEGLELQVRPRSGLAFKQGITVLNSPGTVDSDYRDEIGVLLFNHGNKAFVVRHGDRIAQGVLAPYYKAEFTVTYNVSEIGENRGGGFGSTGTR